MGLGGTVFVDFLLSGDRLRGRAILLSGDKDLPSRAASATAFPFLFSLPWW